MFIGAVQSEPSPMHNADFTVRDLDSSAEWLRRAGSENFEYNQSMKQLQDAMRDKGDGREFGRRRRRRRAFR